VSPTALARLLAAERTVQGWRRYTYAHYRSLGQPCAARYYSARCCWPDALTLVRTGQL